MAPQSLRAYLEMLAERGELRAVGDEVAARYEIAAHLALAGARTALRFERVAGSTMAVVGNVLPTRERIALGLGSTVAELQGKIVAAIGAPVEPRVVEGAPCQEVVEERVDLAALPIPTFFEHETGPYLTAGIIAARDAETGEANLSYARLKPLGADRARVAGALLGEPLEAARAKIADILVPAHCEMVLEGLLDARETVEEGAVSEYHGMYEDYGPGYAVRFERLTRRRDAMLQVIQPGYYPEHVQIGAEAIAAGLARRLRESFDVSAVAITAGGAGRLHAVVALKGLRGGEARAAMFAVWSALNLVKQVTVVDDDVDPWDATRVELALATRMRADRDLLVAPAMPSNRSDPLARDGMVPKLGIDATRKSADRADWRPAQPPQAAIDKVLRRKP